MRETRRTQRREYGPEASRFASEQTSDPLSSTATVAHGPYAEQIAVVGLTVAEIRSRYRDRFDIDPESQALLDGEPADDSETVMAHQVLTFVRKAGEKGTYPERIDPCRRS